MQSATPLVDRAALHAQLHAGASELGLVLSVAASERLLDYVGSARALERGLQPDRRARCRAIWSRAICSIRWRSRRTCAGRAWPISAAAPACRAFRWRFSMTDRAVTLVDSNGKKTRFLREAVRALRLDNVRVVQARAEDVQGTFDCVAARAFASLAEMLARGRPSAGCRRYLAGDEGPRRNARKSARCRPDSRSATCCR